MRLPTILLVVTAWSWTAFLSQTASAQLGGSYPGIGFDSAQRIAGPPPVSSRFAVSRHAGPPPPPSVPTTDDFSRQAGPPPWERGVTARRPTFATDQDVSPVTMAGATSSPYEGRWSTAPPTQGFNDSDRFCDASGDCDFHPLDPRCVCDGWEWQILPDGVLFRNYMAGPKESRLGVSWSSSTDGEWLMDGTLGGKFGFVRYGTVGSANAEGFQLDFDGSAQLRMNWTQSLDVDATDYRFGVPVTWARGPWEWRAGYYHLSSHTGDEFLVRNNTLQRVNYIRDSFVFGLGYFVNPDLRVYGEVDFAFHIDGGAERWHLQFGFDYSPVVYNARRGSPFVAMNVLLREEVNYGGGFNMHAGWQWRARVNDTRLRLGLRYYNGESTQYSFFDEHEQLFGFGLWYDY